MKCPLLCLVGVAVSLSMSGGLAADGKAVTLAGWGIDEGNLDTFMADAEDVGFDTLITWTTEPAVLTRAVEAGRKHHIGIYSCIAPMGGVGSLWREQYPGRTVPWQVMSDDEQAAFKFIMAGKNRYLIPYQFGGEPQLTNEVLSDQIICLNSREGRELFKPLIDGIAAVPGIEGLAFDGFGYQNYCGCNCEQCQKLLAEYRQAHPRLSQDRAAVAFFRGVLVDYINTLAAYARSKRQDLKTSIHVWPVFAPDPLYGNRLDVDYCGQTAAWYTLWPEAKIAEYSRHISGEAREHHQRQEGVGMIGYYDRPGQFPIKDAARVDMELRTMIDNGCRGIQVCGSTDVINNAAIAEVFRKHFR